MKIGDKVRLKFNRTNCIGRIIGIWEENQYFNDYDGKLKIFALKGYFKVSFDGTKTNPYQTFSGQWLEKL